VGGLHDGSLRGPLDAHVAFEPATEASRLTSPKAPGVLLMLGVLLAHLLLMASPAHASMMSGSPDLKAMAQAAGTAAVSSSVVDLPAPSVDCTLRGAPPSSIQVAVPLQDVPFLGPDSGDGPGLSNRGEGVPALRALTRAFLQSFLT